MNPADRRNPYADYTVTQLYDFLSGHQLTRDIGSQYEYSNLGMGLLGHVLALKAATSYEALVKTRILDPLRMTGTAIMLTFDRKRSVAAVVLTNSAEGADDFGFDLVTKR